MPVPEQDRGQDNGEFSPLTDIELSPAVRAALLDPAYWHEGLDRYARTTNLAVALADAEGRLLAPVINPHPLWGLFHARQPAAAAECPFCLAPAQPCTRAAAACAEKGLLIAGDRIGMVHVAVPLLLGKQCLGTLLAGQVFDRYPEQLALEQAAKRFGLPPQEVWQLARREPPLKRATLQVYGELLMTLGRTFLQTRYHTLREAGRLVEMTRLRDQAVTEMAERGRAEESLRESEERLRRNAETFSRLVDQAPFGIYVVDSQLRLYQVNAGAQPVFSNVRPLIGRDFGEAIRIIWPEPFASEVIDLFRRTLETGEPYLAPSLTKQRHDVAVVESYEWQIHRVTLPDGQYGVVCYFFDATAVRQAEQALEEADRRKDQFLAMLAHELRNPLAPLRNIAQVLRLDSPNPSDLEVARDVIDRQVRQIARLVDDLLDVARVTTGKVRLQKEPVDLATVVARAVETSRHHFDARKHELTVALPPEPVWLDADPVRLAQVLANLLNNAAKYTDEGGRIGLTVEREGGEAVVRVRDTGVGIAAEMLPSVFDLFTQADRSLAHAQGGLGIGLSMVRSLVELHGGSVQATSAGLGQGSTFVVRLPLGPGPRRPEEARAKDGGRRAPAPACRILVVDDNKDAANSLALLLKMQGHEVQVAYDGPSALATARASPPGIVFLDLGLPGMDGYEVARRLRQQPAPAKALLVALTGYGQEEDRRHSQEAGFNAHLVKPVDLDTLYELLAREASAS